MYIYMCIYIYIYIYIYTGVQYVSYYQLYNTWRLILYVQYTYTTNTLYVYMDIYHIYNCTIPGD